MALLKHFVSTHSRPKAAGNILLCQPISLAFQHTAARRRLDVRQSLLILHCFNTQPPEGGWLTDDGLEGMSRVFQHTAARRRLVFYSYRFITCMDVSTHSRPKAAGILFVSVYYLYGCFNTQPPEGGWVDEFLIQQHNQVSTHSRPKAAGLSRQRIGQLYNCFNTQPPEGGWVFRLIFAAVRQWFQHTAARRRLVVQTGYPRFF